jgi:hypothetical protein
MRKAASVTIPTPKKFAHAPEPGPLPIGKEPAHLCRDIIPRTKSALLCAIELGAQQIENA